MHQSAREFSSELDSSGIAAGQSSSAPLVDSLVQWISFRFAAAAQSSTFADDPETELRQIRQFLADIVALRRGDLVARRIDLEQRRIDLEQRRLTLEETKNEQTLEKLFWEWTQRPDIRAQLYPHQDPDKMRNDVVRLLDRHLLGVRDQSNHASEPDPAAFI